MDGRRKRIDGGQKALTKGREEGRKEENKEGSALKSRA